MWRWNTQDGDLPTLSLGDHACLHSFFSKFNIYSFILLSIHSFTLRQSKWFVRMSVSPDAWIQARVTCYHLSPPSLILTCRMELKNDCCP